MAYDATTRLLAARQTIFNRPARRRRAARRRLQTVVALAAAGIMVLIVAVTPVSVPDLRAALCGPLGLHEAGFGEAICPARAIPGE